MRARLELRRIEIAAVDAEIRALQTDGKDAPRRQITPQVIERFSAMMRDALPRPDPHLRRGYLHMLVSEVRLPNQGLIICGAKPDLERAVARAAATPGAPVPTFARKWRTREDSNL